MSGGTVVELWVDGGHDAVHNMGTDTALLDAALQRPEPFTLMRLFTFAPPGITLGRAQRPADELDLDALARDGVAWAVRPTGGRAIWHDEEWTFSLVTRLSPEGWARTPSEAYARTGQLLAASLVRLGVPATLAPGSPRGVGAPRSRVGAAPPCFASTARHELLLEGRKLAGIAQRAVRDVLLQQGSLLLGDSHLRLAHYQRGGGDAAALAAGAAHAGGWLGADRSLARWGEAVRAELGEVPVWHGEAGARRFGATSLPRPA